MDDPSDQRLIRKAINGDSEAFTSLVERYYSIIFRIAYKWSGTQSDAEDITHDVCVKLGQAIRSFKGKSAFSSWLYCVTLNTVRDFQRSRKRQMETISALAFISEAACPPDAELRAEQDHLWKAVHTLPEKQRDAILLIYSEELSHAQAAEIMDCAESTVSWHVHEAKKQLRRLLKDTNYG